MEFSAKLIKSDNRYVTIFSIGILSLVLYLISPSILIVLSIIILDFLLSYLKSKKFDIGIDIMSIGIIYLSYFSDTNYAFFLVPFMILTRITLGNIDLKHFIKALIGIFLIIMTSVFRFVPFLTLAVMLLIIRYILDLSLNKLITGKFLLFDKIHHLFATMIFLYILSEFI